MNRRGQANMITQIGPYSCLEPLGEVRGGVAYRAVSADGAAVVVRLMAPMSGRADMGLARSLAHWASVRHPQVAPLLEHGRYKGQLWYATPVMGGIPLREHAQGWSYTAALLQPRADAVAEDITVQLLLPPPEPVLENLTTTAFVVSPLVPIQIDEQAPVPVGQVSEALRVAEALAGVLAGLHSKGLVQGLLCPTAIHLGADGQPWVVDPGVGVTEQLRAVQGGGELPAGMEPYVYFMAPEVARGERLTPRADLFALGALLYWMLTGRTPLTGTPRDVLRAVSRAWPARQIEARGGLPEPLSQLVYRLITKSPYDRPADALTVQAALAALRGHGGDVPLDGRQNPALMPPRYHGRKAVRQRLLRAGRSIDDGQGCISALCGVAHSGRRHTLREIARRVEVRGARCLWAHAGVGPAGGGARAPALSIFAPVFELLGEEVSRLGVNRAEMILGPCGPVLGPYHPNLARLAPEAQLSTLSRCLADGGRERLFDFLLRALRALTQRQRLTLLVSDLHLADELSLSFLAYLCQPGRLAGVPLWILCACDEGRGGEGLKAVLEAPEVLVERLTPFTAAQLSGLAEDILPGLGPRALALLGADSQGSPGLVVRRLSVMAAAGELVGDASGGWEVKGDAAVVGSPAWSSVQALREAELAAEPAGVQRLLGAVAAAGAADPQWAVSASGAGAEAIERALSHGYLDEAGDGGWMIGDALLAAVAYARQPPGDLTAWHRQLASTQPHTITGALAAVVHGERSGGAAPDDHLRLARLASQGAAYELAAEHYHRAQAHDAAAVSLERALWADIPSGDWARARASLAAVLGGEAPRALLIDAYWALATVALADGGGGEEIALSKALALLLPPPDEPRRWACQYTLQAEVASARGRLEVAVAFLKEALVALPQGSDPYERARVQSALGDCYFSLGYADQSLALQQAARQHLDDQRYPLVMAQILTREAAVLISLGNYVDVRVVLDRALDLHQRWCQAEAQVQCLMGLADAARRGGRLETACSHAREAATAARQQGDVCAELEARALLGDLLWEGDLLRAACEVWEEACAIAEGAGQPLMAAALRLRQARAHRLLLEGVTASDLVSDAASVFAAAGEEGGLVWCRCEQMHQGLSRGDDLSEEIDGLLAQPPPVSPPLADHPLERLRLAQVRLGRGQALILGESPVSLPPLIARRFAGG